MEFAVCIIAALALWFGLDWPLWACIAAVAAVWFMVRGSAHGASPSGAIDAFGRLFGAAGGFIKRFVVSLAVFSAVVMVGSRVIVVAPAAAADELSKFGWLPWNWGRFGWPAIAMVLVALIGAYIGSEAAHGNSKWAGRFIVGSLIAILAVRWIPVTLATALPSEEVMTKDGRKVVQPTWAATDTAVATTYKKHGVVGGGVRWLWKAAFGQGDTSPKPKPAATTPAPAASKPQTSPYKPAVYTKRAVEEPPMKVSAVTPAEITADYAYTLESDAPIMVQYPREKAFLFTPGPCQDLPRPRHSGPKKFWDPEDPEGGHIRFRIYRSDDGRC